MYDESSNPVYSILAIHDLGQGVGSCAEAWVVDENVVSAVAVGQNPMASIVHITDHNFSFVEL